MKKVIFLLLILFPFLNYSQKGFDNKFNIQNIEMFYGIGNNFTTKDNKFLKRNFESMQMSYDYPIRTNQKIGFIYAGTITKIDEEKQIEYFNLGANHKDLISMTKGYGNSFQLGITYSYTFPINNFYLKGKIGTGVLYLTKNTSYMEYYPADTTQFKYKRYMTTYSDFGSKGWGVFGSVQADFGYNFGFLSFFIGSRYVIGNAKKNNMYVEEYDYNGDNKITLYSENLILSVLDFHLGVSFSLDDKYYQH